MTVTVYPVTPPTETRWVKSYRFLFQLHDKEQQVILLAVEKAADAMTPGQSVDMTPGATDASGYPLAVLRVFAIAYQMMDALGGQVDLLSPDMNEFFQAASAIGMYGDTPEAIAAEIARIKSDTLPA